MYTSARIERNRTARINNKATAVKSGLTGYVASITLAGALFIVGLLERSDVLLGITN